ncbi:MAG TPA: hypothetical protein VFS60_00805 [Thermoanaerobaculia bacterium]|nr:hypothetical protein [Thermoanaerobaculia bacterium]
MAEKKGWVVTTSQDRTIGDVAKDLKKAGFTVEQVLEEIGSITGGAGEDVAQKVRSIPGVLDVSPDTPVDIGPPDSDLW